MTWVWFDCRRLKVRSCCATWAARVARAHHLADVERLGMVRPQLLEREVAEAEHGHQLVVHLVGDAARERADRLELLGLAELLLGQHLVGDVHVRADPFAHPAALVVHRHRPHVHVTELAVLTAQPVPRHQHAALADGLLPGALHRGAVVGVDRLEPAPAAALGLGLAGEGRPLGRVAGAAAVGARRPDDLGRRRHQRAVAGLARAAPRLRQVLLGDVAVHLDHRLGAALRIAVQDPVGGDQDGRAVPRLAGHLAFPLALLGQDGRRLARRHRELGRQQLATVAPVASSADQP